MTQTAIPAKAGTHLSAALAVTQWVPAFAGIAVLGKVYRLMLAALFALAGCAGSPEPQPFACLLPAEQRMLVAELFFGRNIPGREPLTEAEWADFAARTVTPNFPGGFTASDGQGQWQNPATGQIGREPTKILLIAAKREPDLARRLSAVIDAYKTRFRQQSVGIITRDACAAF